MFMVFSKDKIISYLVSIGTVALLFVISFAMTKNNEEIIRGREIFKRFVRKIEKDFKNYSEVDKEKLSELLYQFYKELSNKIEISQREEFEWNSIGIELFRLKKYKKYWEPGMNIIQVP